MRARPHWRVVLTVAVALGVISNLGVLLFLGQLQPSDAVNSAKFVSWAAIVVYGLWLGFEKWGWAFFPEWIIGRPDLRGTWKGTGYFSFIKDKDLKSTPISLEVQVSIKQTYTKIFVGYWSKSDTDQRETRSEAYADLLQPSPGDGNFVLQYIFATLPGSFIPNQIGWAALAVSDDRKQMEGDWLFNLTEPAAGHLVIKLQ